MPQTHIQTPITTVVRELAEILARIGTSGDILRDELTSGTRLQAHAAGIGLSVDHATVLVRQIAVFVAEQIRDEDGAREREDASRGWDAEPEDFDEPEDVRADEPLEGSPAH